MSCEARGMLSEVRELPKDDLRLLRLSSFRTPDGRRCGSGEDVVVCEADAGDMGVRKLSVRICRAWLCELGILDAMSVSGSGVGGKAPGNSSGVVGCDVSGPPPGVGGLIALAGDAGGESSGAGMLVPAVREYSTGLTESGM